MPADRGREVVIVEAVRTPIGRGHKEKGYYKDTHPNELLGRCYTEVIERAGIPAEEVEDVVTACVLRYGKQRFNVGGNAWLQAGLPGETPAATVDRQCGSAQQAVNFGAALVASGVHDAVIGSGVEHMGHIPMGVGFKWVDDVGSPWPRALLEKYNLVPQGISAEMIADKWEIPRSELDEIGLRSHQNAAQATEEGRFEREIAPFSVNGDTYVTDQGIRPDTSLEKLSEHKPAFPDAGKYVGGEENLRITAGNSSQISDGAAAVLLMSREKADALGLKPRARILDQTTVGVDPVIMLTGPIPATRKLLERNGMKIGDIDLIEINEAFASVVAAWRRELEPDMDRVNVNGGAIALGHPLGSTGARLGASLNHPNVVMVYDIASDDEGVLIVMECVEGHTLREEIASGPVAPERALPILRGVAEALDHAHAHGVLHRDVKPANILLRSDGAVKLADLGIATAAEQTRITRAGSVVGTASYIAPERLDGAAGGPAADVYALAAVAFEALTGRRAVEGANALEVAQRMASAPPPDLRDFLPGAPAAAAEALKRGLARDPDRRPGSAKELVEALARAFATQPGPTYDRIRDATR